MPPNPKRSKAKTKPKQKPTPLPTPLRYLHPFLKSLAKLPLDQLTEDLDPTPLESALRKHLRGLDQDAAEAQITKDHKLLKSWLKTFDSRLHPAHWIVGYLSFPSDIAAALTKPPDWPPRGRKITFDPPPGWEVESFPLQLDLKSVEIIGTIMASDESSFDFRVSQYEIAHATRAPRVQAVSVVSKITRGRTTGKKFLYVQSAPAPWKRVDYLLRVKGGYVDIVLQSMTGANFDESPLEAQLHTIAITDSTP